MDSQNKEEMPPWVGRLFKRLEKLEEQFDSYLADRRSLAEKLPAVQSQNILLTSRVESMERKCEPMSFAFSDLQAHQHIQDQRLDELEQIMKTVIEDLREGLLKLEEKQDIYSSRIFDAQADNTKKLTEHIRTENKDQIKIFATTVGTAIGIIFLILVNIFKPFAT